MRKIQLSIFTLLLMIGSIGLAFAIFRFNDPISKSAEFGIELVEYRGLGELNVEQVDFFKDENPVPVSGVTGFTIDNSAEMARYHARVFMKHVFPVDGELLENGADYDGAQVTVEILNSELGEYLTAKVERETTWIEFDETGRFAVFRVWLEWKEGKEVTDLESWNHLNQVFTDAVANDTAKIVLTVTIAPNA